MSRLSEWLIPKPEPPPPSVPFSPGVTFFQRVARDHKEKFVEWDDVFRALAELEKHVYGEIL